MRLGERARSVFLGLVFLFGAFTGVPMRAEDIEQLLNAHNQVKEEETVRNDEDKDER